MFKKVLCALLCVCLLASLGTVAVMADEAKTVVDGARWFPVEAGRENDILWEAEAGPDLFQPFYENADTTGATNYLDTVYGEDGSLTITRNGVDDKGDWFWPSVRTLYLESYPEMDITVANTLYFNLEATHDWNIYVCINGMNIKMGKSIAEACGVTSVATTDNDAPAGTYQGSLNLQDAFNAIVASEPDSSVGQFAKAILSMKKTFVPQIMLYVVGPVQASLTVKEFFISTAEDTTGANCEFVDMGMIMGDDYYETQDEPADEPTDEPADEPAEDETDATTTTTKAVAKDEGGANVGLIIGIVAAVIVIAVVVVVVLKKKKA